jgi:deoxyadenosine/deoxycytidine kinase
MENRRKTEGIKEISKHLDKINESRDGPLVVSITGPIAVGKTTVVDNLSNHSSKFKVVEEPVRDNPYLTLFYKDPKKYSLLTQQFFLNHRHETWCNELDEIDQAKKIYLFDRSLSEDIVFAKTQRTLRNMSEKEFSRYMEDYQSKLKNSPMEGFPHIMIYLKADPKTCLKRLAERNNSYESGITEEYMTTLINQYDEFADDCIKKGVPVVKLDWSEFGDVYKMKHDFKKAVDIAGLYAVATLIA